MTADPAAARRRPRFPDVGLAGGRRLTLDARVLVMGVVNVTPDSFWSGSRTPRPDQAVERGLALVADGADLLDIGGESTRPGSEDVGTTEELERVLPVIEGLRKASAVPLSVDTRKSAVARAAVQAGADAVNDVSGFTADPAMAGVIAELGAIGILMHMRGTPRTMQREAHYEDVVLQVKAELGVRIAGALRAGIDPGRLWIDPGIGFAKTARHNLEILHRLEEFLVFDKPIVLGTSRKSFIGKVLGEDDPAGRLEGSLATTAVAVLKGASVVRVHDVAATRRATRMVEAILDPAIVER